MKSTANLYSFIANAAKTVADKAAVVEAGRRPLTYGQLHAQVAQTATWLTETIGIAPGDRITVHAEKSVESLVLYLASLAIGAVYNPLNTAYTAAELEYFIGDAEPKLLVAGAKTIAGLRGRAAMAGVATHTLEPDGSGTLHTGRSAVTAPSTFEPVARARDDLACLLYTSGTTGRSKGAMIMHGNLVSNGQTLVKHWGLTSDDTLLHALPIYHVHGLFVALHTALLSGTTIIWQDKFDAKVFRARLPEATVIMGVPTFYTRLLDQPGFGRSDVPKLRLAISGSAPLLAETHRAFEAATGHAILERYGMTETGMITSNPCFQANDASKRVAGTVGFALPGVEVRIADQAGTVLADGEIGVLEVRGPNVFKGYWRNPEKTAEEFRRDGFFITGDVSVRAPDGRVTIVGRAKDLIISGGFNVYPKEIETEIDALPGVGESAVIGVPHKDFGEGVVAVLTAAPGKPAPTEADVIAALKDRLAKFKQPKRVFVVAELPRNAMGKVQKAELRKIYAKTFG